MSTTATPPLPPLPPAPASPRASAPPLPRSVARPVSQVLAERRRIKTETSASGGWGLRLQALFPQSVPTDDKRR